MLATQLPRVPVWHRDQRYAQFAPRFASHNLQGAPSTLPQAARILESVWLGAISHALGAFMELAMRADILERLDDYFRPADVGMEIGDFRRRYWWLTEYGDRLDPYYSRAELIGGG